MLQEGDRNILANIGKVIAALVIVTLCLIGLASYIGSIT
jgi:hypothetical protein